MVGYDNPTCAYEWFHLTCLELMSQPKSKYWYCGRSTDEEARMAEGVYGDYFFNDTEIVVEDFPHLLQPIFRLLRVVRAREHKLFFERGWKALPEFAAGNFVSFRLREGLVFYT